MRKLLFLLSLIIFTSAPPAHDKPDTALVVTTYDDFWIDDHWSYESYTIKGYDNEKRIVFTSFHGGMEPVRSVWDYSTRYSREVRLFMNPATLAWETHERITTHHKASADSIVIQDYDESLWDNFEDPWVNRGLKVIRYNPSGLRIEAADYWWDAGWVAETRVLYEYNGDGKRSQVIDQNWNETEEKWVNSRRIVSEYDDQGRIELKSEYSWKDANWEKRGETVYSYSVADGNTVKKARISIIVTIGGSLELTRIVYDTINSEGNTIGSLELLSTMVPNRRIDYIYDYMGNLLTKLTLYYSEEEGWEYFSRIRNEYAYYKDDPTMVARLRDNDGKIRFRESRAGISLTGLDLMPQAVTCQIFDLKGRMVFSRMIKAGTRKALDISNRQLGSQKAVLVMLKDMNGNILFRGKMKSINR